MLKARIITALVLVTALGLILFVMPPIAAGLAFAVIAATAAWEWAGLMKQDMPARYMYGGSILFCCWQLTANLSQLVPILFGLATVFWLLVVPLWFRYKWTLAGNDMFGYLLGALVILPTWAAMVALHAVDTWLMLGVMALVWVADIAAYFAGRAFGLKFTNSRLAPTISPGKSWEGVWGGMVGVVVLAWCWVLADAHWQPTVASLYTRLAEQGMWLMLLSVLFLAAMSVVGDLVESLIKRSVGVKDSSGLLPGHGGVLDRVDALLPVLPLAMMLVSLIP